MNTPLRTSLPIGFGLAAVFAFSARAADYELLPSNAPVKEVILQYRMGGLRRNPRVELIRHVVAALPGLPVHVIAEADIKEFWKAAPELKGKIARTASFATEANHVQDWVEIGYVVGKPTPVIFGINDFKLVSKVKELFPSATVVEVQKGGGTLNPAEGVVTGDDGGNLEVLPDGTPVVGDTMTKKAATFFETATGKRRVEIRTSRVGVGHVDEQFLWTTDPAGKSSCLLFYADATSGVKLINEKSLAEWKTGLIRDEGTWLRELDLTISVDFLTKPQNDREKKLAAKVHENIEKLDRNWDAVVKRLHEELSANDTVDKTIRDNLRMLTTHPSMKRCRSIAMPMVFENSGDKSSPKFSAKFDNPINALVIRNHAFLFKPTYPALGAEVKRIYEANGFTVHWEERNGFNALAGGVHCSSYTLRARAGAR